MRSLAADAGPVGNGTSQKWTTGSGMAPNGMMTSGSGMIEWHRGMVEWQGLDN